MSSDLLDFLEVPSKPFTRIPLSTNISVTLHRPGETKVIHLENFFPFMSLIDLKLAIYDALGQKDSAIPECIYLTSETGTVDFAWVGIKELVLPNPLEAAEGPVDTRFVDSNGNRRIVKFVRRDRIMVEDMYEDIPQLSAYLFEDVAAAIPGPKPPSERDWYGHISQYFPYLELGGPTAEQAVRAKRLFKIFMRRSQLASKVERLLDTPMEPLRLTGVRSMRLLWHKTESIPGIEAVFYDADVNDRRPYMRFIPTEGSAISKIHMIDDRPDLADPKLLLQWSQERSPIPNHDFVMAKVKVRPGYVNVAPIYGTLRALDDGTADYTLVPPKGMRKLEPDDLNKTWSLLKEVRFPFLREPTLDNGNFVFGLKLKKEFPITSRIIRERLPLFAAFFQETTPLGNDTPLVSIRYKAVSNFATEDRVFTFITQILNRKMMKEEGVSNLVEIVAEEFQLDMEEARKRVADRLQQQGDIAVVKPDSGEFMGQYNPGIDIYIFGQHPFYTFHMQRINSYRTMQRVTMLLSLLMCGTTEDFIVSEAVTKELMKAEMEEAGMEAVAEAVAEKAVDAPIVAAIPEPKPEPKPQEQPDEYDEGYDAFLDDFAAEFDEEPVEAVDPKKALEALPEPPLPSPDPPKPLAKPIAKPEQNVEVSTTKDVSIANFFINKLKEADRRLFDYTKTHASLKKYTQQCQPTDGRQPAVLTQEKYNEMLEEYRGEVTFLLYPIDPAADTAQPEGEHYTVLRYGTSSEKQHYYLCSQYFCTRDEILVRESDLNGTTMRRPLRLPNGTVTTTKLPGQCPFCQGVVIKNKAHPSQNEVIIERGIKKQSDNRRHLFIRFLKKTPHPEGFYLPCCFIEPEPIRVTDPPFDKYKELGISVRPDTDVKDAPRQGPTLESGIPIVDYFSVLQTLGKRGKYILGSEKFPLELGLVTAAGRGEPQVGLLPPEFDEYFNQASSDLVTRALTQQTLKEGTAGFLRVGVENRLRYKGDSFLAACAPYFKLNSAAEVKAEILSVVTARVFLGLNYGNLVLEFYDPRMPRPEKTVLDKILAAFIEEEELETSVYEQTREPLYRLYNSFNSFKIWLADTKTQKEYRHFALMFSQPGLIGGRSRVGTTFIVLDVTPSGMVEVRCPPYGYNDDLMGKNSVAFLLHKEGVWEPIFYMDTRAARTVDAATLSFMASMKGYTGTWPQIVKQRVSEFASKCAASGRSVYASQSRMNPAAMIPMSLLYRVLRKGTEKNKNIVFEGVLRDSYNHVGALLYRNRTSNGLFAVPVIDDGNLEPFFGGGRIFLDWDDPEYRKGTVTDIIDFYSEYIDTSFSLYPGYIMQNLVRKGDQEQPYVLREEDIPHIVAIKLRNGLYIPAARPTEKGGKLYDAVGKASVVQIQEEEWEINNGIIYDKTITNPMDVSRIEYDELQELFEHLRLTMSNFLATSGGGLRSIIQTIVMDRTISIALKRRQLEILLGPVVMNQMMTEDEAHGEASILRTDCTLRSEGDCKGRCAWSQSGNKCMIHVNKSVDISGKGGKVSVRLLLLRRLIEELIRYSERRRQIFEQKVSQMAAIDGPIVIKGAGEESQLVIPEKSTAWFELLRLEWAVKKDEPKYLEEMSRDPRPATFGVGEGPISDDVIQQFGADPKWLRLKAVKASWPAILTTLGLATYDVSGGLSIQQIEKMANDTKKPVVYVGDETIVYSPVNKTFLSVIFIIENGPQLVVGREEGIVSLNEGDLPSAVMDKIMRASVPTKA